MDASTVIKMNIGLYAAYGLQSEYIPPAATPPFPWSLRRRVQT